MIIFYWKLFLKFKILIFHNLLLYYFRNIWTDIKNYRYYLNEIKYGIEVLLKLDILTYNELWNFNHLK